MMIIVANFTDPTECPKLLLPMLCNAVFKGSICLPGRTAVKR